MEFKQTKTSQSVKNHPCRAVCKDPLRPCQGHCQPFMYTYQKHQLSRHQTTFYDEHDLLLGTLDQLDQPRPSQSPQDLGWSLERRRKHILAGSFCRLVLGWCSSGFLRCSKDFLIGFSSGFASFGLFSNGFCMLLLPKQVLSQWFLTKGTSYGKDFLWVSCLDRGCRRWKTKMGSSQQKHGTPLVRRFQNGPMFSCVVVFFVGKQWTK